MRAAVSVVLDDGTVMEGVAELAQVSSRSLKAPSERESAPGGGSSRLDFEFGPRPFMKKHAAGLSGPERLILLVAYFAHGNTQTPVPRVNVVNQWAKMTSIMGGSYNGAYDTRARDTGWLHSPKPGVFELRPGWETVLR
jgi:hypothetical protein